MSSTAAPSTTTPAPTSGRTSAGFDDARWYRIAGWSAVVAGLSYLVQPIIVFSLFPPVTSSDPAAGFDDVASVMHKAWTGPVELVLFTTIGVALITLSVAVGRLLAGRAGLGAVWPRVTTVLGSIAGAGWLFAAATGAALRSSVGAALADTGADQTVQRAVIQGVNIVLTAGLLLGVVAFGGWLLGVIVLGRRGAVFGWPLTIASIIMFGCVLTAAIPALPPLGILLLIPYLLTIGVAFLVKARSAR